MPLSLSCSYFLVDESIEIDVSFEDCLANDWLGSKESARRLCKRGADVARQAILTRPLADWFERLGEGFGTL